MNIPRRTFILTWNEASRHSKSYEDYLHCYALKKEEVFPRWNCGLSKSITEGDRIFLLRYQGQNPGLIGSGWGKGLSYKDKHYDPKFADFKSSYVDVKVETLLTDEQTIPLAELASGALSSIFWKKRTSGTILDPQTAKLLEDYWHAHLVKLGLTSESPE